MTQLPLFSAPVAPVEPPSVWARMGAYMMGGPEPVELADARAHRYARVIAERHRAEVRATWGG